MRGNLWIKRKLIKLFLVIILSINQVYAEEKNELKDITDNVEIRYKWYKEKIEGDYYPLKDHQEGYIVDIDKIKYGPVKYWNKENCSLSNRYYFKEYDTRKTYRIISRIRYVELEDFIFNDNIKIYYENKLINYNIITNNKNTIMLDLKKICYADRLIFYIKSEKEYKINLYNDSRTKIPILSKVISEEGSFIPDETWKISTTEYENLYTRDNIEETTLTKKIGEEQICQATEIYVYKYKVEKEYYDNNYHLNVDGYIKDLNDYKIFYQENPIINTIEITKEKIVKQPQIEYINLSSTIYTKNKENLEISECIPQIKTEIKTIKKEIFKIPKKVYIIIATLILIITFLLMKLCKKYVVQSF